MFVTRYAVGTSPTDSAIRELEQIVIVEQDAPVAVQGAGQKACVIGEAVNDHGAPNVPRTMESKGELASYYGGLERWAAAGFEGSLFAALRPVNFPTLVVIVPDMAGGVTTITGTCDDADTQRVLPAGTRLSDGSTSIWATLEDLTFTGSYPDSQDVRVRHVSGATTLGTGALDTVIDTVTHLIATSDNADAVTAVDVDAAYATAIEASTNETSEASGTTVMWACRHDAAIQQSLRDAAIEASSGGRGRIAVLAPPVGTTKTDAFAGSMGVAVSRDSRYCYGWPGWQYLLSEYSTTAYVTVCGDTAVACLIANLAPWESIGQETPLLGSYIAGEITTGATYTRTFYVQCKAAGICAPYIDKLGNKIIYSSVTTEISLDNWKPVEQRKFADYIEDSLAAYWQHSKDKLLTTARRDSNVDAANDFLEGEAQQAHGVEPGGYSVHETSSQADLDAGVQKILVKVKRISAMKALVMLAQVGTTVQISEQQ